MRRCWSAQNLSRIWRMRILPAELLDADGYRREA